MKTQLDWTPLAHPDAAETDKLNFMGLRGNVKQQPDNLYEGYLTMYNHNSEKFSTIVCCGQKYKLQCMLEVERLIEQVCKQPLKQLKL